MNEQSQAARQGGTVRVINKTVSVLLVLLSCALMPAWAGPSTTTLSASPNPVSVNQSLTLTATVSGAVPTGTVTFKDGTTTVGTAAVSGGSATLNTSLNSVGGHSLTATYDGDANNDPSTSSAALLNVSGANAVVTLALSTNKVQPSVSFTLTATVSGASPTGSVTFRDGAAVLGSASLVSGQGTFNASLSSLGVHNLTASYSGDVTNNPSVSETKTLLVSTNVNAPAPAPAMSWSYEYNAKGSLTKTTDANGLVTQHGYDLLEQRTLTTQPIPAPSVARPTIGVAYDGQGNVAQVTDPRSLPTTYTVTGLGSTTQQVSPDTGTTASTVNELGQPLVVTDARGKTTTYAYDSLNRVASITYSAGPPTIYTWDGGTSPPPNSKGKLTGISDESGTTAYTYDGLGRIASKTQVVGPASKSFSVQYGYGSSGNALGQLQSITYPSGVVVSYSYDNAGRPTGVGISGPAGNKTVLSGLSYNALSSPKSWLWGDGTLMQRSFDAYGRLASYPLGYPGGSGAAAGTLRAMVYDATGRITGYSHTTPGAALDQIFGYDGLDRLTSATQSANSFSYAYDATGNRTQAVINGTAYNHTVSSTSNRYTSIQAPGTGGPQTQSQGYDNAGNLASDAQGAYTYSDRGRLQSATRAGNTVNYLVNALQQRVHKSGPSQIISTGQAYYVYDEQSRLIGEYDANAGLIQETIYLNDTPVGVVKGDGSLGYIYSDHLDTPRVIARSTGDHAIVWRWDSTEAFGNTQANSNPNALGSYEYSPRFPGQVADQESGWHYNVNRDYNPSLGRYVQSDPLGVLPGAELASPGLSRLSPRLRAKLSKVVIQLNQPYAYVDSNPVSQIDPDGLEPTTLGRIGLGAARGGLGGARGGLVGIGLGIGLGAMAEMCSPTDRDRDERQCDADYDAGREFCHAMAVTKGRHRGTKKYAETYSQCMRAVDEEYIECYQRAGK